jgi:hypothetical protein
VGRKARRGDGIEEEARPGAGRAQARAGRSDAARTSRTSAGSCRSLSRPTTGGATSVGGLKADDAKRLTDLKRENAALKRLLADAELEKAALKEIARGNF